MRVLAMFIRLHLIMLSVLCAFSLSAQAETIEVSFEIPDIDTSQYRRPFVAIWLEEKTNWKSSQSLALWYDDAEWLKDLRRWWRKVGRYDKELDAFSGATKPAGRYKIAQEVNLEEHKAYVLYIEAVREHGNRTLLKAPISAERQTSSFSLEAGREVGPVTISIQ